MQGLRHPRESGDPVARAAGSRSPTPPTAGASSANGRPRTSGNCPTWSAPRSRRSAAGAARRWRSAPSRWSAPVTCWRRAAPNSCSCSCAKREKPFPTRCRSCARRWITCATTQPRRATRWRRRWRCRAPPASTTSCSCTVAACSPASAPGISRWRSSAASCRPRWLPATRCWPSRPSRPTLWRCAWCSCCTRPGFPRPRCSWCSARAPPGRRWSRTSASAAWRSRARPRSHA